MGPFGDGREWALAVLAVARTPHDLSAEALRSWGAAEALPVPDLRRFTDALLGRRPDGTSRATRPVVGAMAALLERAPSPAHLLQPLSLVSAAAPLIDDPNHLAHLIDRTNPAVVPVAAASVAATTEQFRAILRGPDERQYDARVAVRLIASLIADSNAVIAQRVRAATADGRQDLRRERLAARADSEDPLDRIDVAREDLRDLPEVLERLANDPDASVRYYAKLQMRMDEAQWQRFEAEYWVSALRHPDAPRAAIERGIERDASDAGWHIATNPAAPPELLVALWERAEGRTRSLLRRVREFDPEVQTGIVRALIENQRTPTELLLSLARYQRARRATHSDFDERAGHRLEAALGRHEVMRFAAHPNCTVEVLEILLDVIGAESVADRLRQRDGFGMTAVVEHNRDPRILDAAIRQAGSIHFPLSNPAIAAETLEYVAACDHIANAPVSKLVEILRHPNANRRVCDRLTHAADRIYGVRLGNGVNEADPALLGVDAVTDPLAMLVVVHPDTSDTIRRAFLRHIDPRVRASAMQELGIVAGPELRATFADLALEAFDAWLQADPATSDREWYPWFSMVAATLSEARAPELSEDTWQRFTTSGDHDVRFAASRIAPPHLLAAAPAREVIHLTHVMSMTPEYRRHPRDAQVWADLPESSVVPFKLCAEAAALRGTRLAVDGREFVLSVIDTPRALRLNGEHMGNCTNGYRSQIHDGLAVMCKLHEVGGSAAELNAVFKRGARNLPWRVGEINTRFNQAGDLCDQLRPLLEGLAAGMSGASGRVRESEWSFGGPAGEDGPER